MTDNRETIEMLKMLKEQALKSHNDTAVLEVKIDSFNFVLDKAIKALEQQPCEDAINRQDALNCVTFNEFRYRIVEDIKALPSVTPKEKTGWIPVNERLPEESKRYVVFTKYNEVMTDFYTGERFLQGDDIIAWMPLPEPYKAESEE